jgi:predicted nucleic acid-binding protein
MEIILKAYLDTSVFGALVDKEPAHHLDATQVLFNRLREGEISGIISDLSLNELNDAPESLKKIFQPYIKLMSIIYENDESRKLAATYFNEKVFSKSQDADARHVSISTIHRIPTIISWNFRHLVNVARRRMINGINVINGYPLIDVISPLEVRYAKED